MPTKRSIPFRALLIALALTLASAGVAYACGIYIPREGSGVIGQERALIRHLDGVETIVLELSVTGETSEAAWILPVPNPAEVALANTQIFTELAEITAPQIETRYYDPDSDGMPAGAAPRGAVQVFSRQTLGPFDVVSLTGDDAEAVATWLAENDFAFPDELADILAPYIAEQWAFAAVRLAPADQGGEIGGQLDPLAFTFASDEIVYPLRPAALGTGDRPLFLYILTTNKVIPDDLPGASYDTTLQFAGELTPDMLADTTVLADYVTEPLYLTKWLVNLWDVKTVASDLYFSPAADNTPFRDTVIKWEARGGELTDMFRCSWLPMLGMVAVGAVMYRRRTLP